VLVLAAAAASTAAPPVVERVTTAVPFPRGLAMVEERLLVLCRGRVRGPQGGVSATVDDQAGTIYAVDPTVSEPLDGPVGDRVRNNGVVLARPTEPPFRLWDRRSEPPESDRMTDRPYCTLRYHAGTDSLYVCAFSGIDKRQTRRDPVAFSKNRTDAVLRFDRRTGTWHEVERHDHAAGWEYPHHDPQTNPPPHGWLNGPDNCLPLGDGLYAVAKDNSLLVRYDLSGTIGDPYAPPPAAEVVLGAGVDVSGAGRRAFFGHSALAAHDGWLYIGYRTSSAIVRIALDAELRPQRPIVAELVARFDAFDPRTLRSADITDMDFDDDGRLYVISARPARVYRFRPGTVHDGGEVFDARDGGRRPWIDLDAIVRGGNQRFPPIKSENLLHHDGWLYVTTGDGYRTDAGTQGAVYRVRVDD
jgi:hypothetical protein